MGTSVFSRRALLTAASAASGSWVLSACGSQEPQASGNASATAYEEFHPIEPYDKT